MKRLFLTFIAVVSITTLHAAEIVAVAHPWENLPNDKTVVWTPLFQAAWDDLHRGFGAPVKIDPPNALMDRLDHFPWKAEAVMPRDHWKVWAGDATKELIDKANAEAARITGENKGPFQIEPRPGNRIALGLLDRNLVFKKPLHRSVDAPLVFHSADGTNLPVRFFGTRHKASGGYGGVVRVLAYQAGSHALQIASDADDSAVLYLPEKPVSFIEACAKLREWRSKELAGAYGSVQDRNLHEKDDVRIPVLKLENTTDFVPLLGSVRYFESGVPWKLYKAEQRLKFALTEKGAKLRVKVEMDMEPFGEAPMMPRFFHYDRPFFVFLWRDGAEWPYFGAWVGNGAPMEEFKEP
jgi:hypothetical protein